MLFKTYKREFKLLNRKWIPRSYVHICLYFGLLSLLIQICIFFSIIFIFEESLNWKVFSRMSDPNNKKIDKSLDFRELKNILFNLNIKPIILDKYILRAENKARLGTKSDCITCQEFDNVPVVLGISYGAMQNDGTTELVQLLQNANFTVTTFYNSKPMQLVKELADVTIAYFVQRVLLFQLVILHAREDNTWWFGDLNSDVKNYTKLARYGMKLSKLDLMQHEGSIEKFELTTSVVEKERNMFFPKDIPKLLFELQHSKFIECNTSRADYFHNQFKRDNSAVATRFRHKAWKLLSRAKTVLDSLGIEFWISSGTCLGYYRECDIIAHSKDVDLGLWARDYTSDILTEMKSHGFNIKLWLGRPNDSLEMSFVDNSGIKLDMFFFYEDGNVVWNGGTQVKSGKKFKYVFPKFDLCWTLFQDLRVRIPCDTESYIRANYGSDWFHPVTFWDWKTSPSNVQANGVWKLEEQKDVIKVFF